MNWWDGIKYDLKTITSIGWAPSMIPEEMVIDRFFAAERDALAVLEHRIAEDEIELAEAVEKAQAALEYEASEDESITAALMRTELNNEIGDDESVVTLPLREALNSLKVAESTLKDHKGEYKQLSEILALKVEFKLFGSEDKLDEESSLLAAAEKELAAAGGPLPQSSVKRTKGQPNLTEAEKAQVKKRKTLSEDVATLRCRISNCVALAQDIGGIITEEQARELILNKHHDLVAGCLERYLQAEERVLFAVFENLFAKYSASAESIEASRAKALNEVKGFLARLGYV